MTDELEALRQYKQDMAELKYLINLHPEEALRLHLEVLDQQVQEREANNED